MSNKSVHLKVSGLKKRPALSVVLCTYNGSQFIEDQLRSIFSQTYPIDELIIVDDNSSDDTVEIITAVTRQFPFVRIFKNESRLGSIKNFEKALLLVQNDLIAISDQDDIWHPEKLEKLIANFREESLLIYCNSVRFTDQPDFSAMSNPKHIRFSGVDARKIFIFNSVSGHAMIIRKRLLDYSMPFHHNVMYDWWMAVVRGYNGGVEYYPEVLVWQRVHSNNVSVSGKYDYGASKSRKNFKQLVLAHLKQFIHAPGIASENKAMAEKLLRLWEDALYKKYSPQLFFFLLKHRKILFAFKKKRTAFFTHLKYCWRFSKN